MGTAYLLSLHDNYQWLHLVHRLNMYCSYNYCKYILHIIIAQVIRSVVGAKGLNRIGLDLDLDNSFVYEKYLIVLLNNINI